MYVSDRLAQFVNYLDMDSTGQRQGKVFYGFIILGLGIYRLVMKWLMIAGNWILNIGSWID